MSTNSGSSGQAWAVLAIILEVSTFISALFLTSNRENFGDWVPAWILFSLPALLIPCLFIPEREIASDERKNGARVLRRAFLLMALPKNAGLLLYWHISASDLSTGPALTSFAAFALMLITIAIGLAVVYKMIAVIEGVTSEADPGKYLSWLGPVFATLGSKGFVALGCLGTVFLYSTYYLTLSLAFYDLTMKGQALKGPGAGSQITEIQGDVQGDAAPMPANWVWFDEARISFPGSATTLDACETEGIKQLADSGSRSFSYALSEMSLQDDCRSALATSQNLTKMHQLLAKAESNQSQKLYLMAWGGSASEPWVSDARAYFARDLFFGLKSENVLIPDRPMKTVTSLPANDVLLALYRDGVAATTSPTPKWNRKPLIDYIYFMIYTVTTTGYGDLRPATGIAKFLSSVGNLVEILFLVIAFNLFHALRSRQSPTSDTQKAQT